MTNPNNTHNVDADGCTAVIHSEAVAPFENIDPWRCECTVTADAPPPALIEAADIAGIFARSKAALDLGCVEGTYSRAEQCLEQVWRRVRQRCTLIEIRLAAVAANTLSLRASQLEIALSDAWQRFEGQPEEREALLSMYAALVAHIAWPKGFARHELLEKFLLE